LNIYSYQQGIFQIGISPALVDLKYIFATQKNGTEKDIPIELNIKDDKEMRDVSLFFTFVNAGYIVGSFLGRY
jgi:hypothetical protein